MKYTLSILLGLLLLSCNNKDNYSKITVLEYGDSTLKGIGDTVEIAYLNPEKRFISRDIRDNNVSKLTTYNQTGKIISFVVKYNASFSVKTERKIDEFGSDLELKNFEIGKIGDTTFSFFKNEYNSDSTSIISSIFDNSHNLIGLEERTLDSKKNLLSLISKDPTGRRVLQKQLLIYDRESNNIETDWFDSLGILRQKDVYIYNDKNQLIKETHFENGKIDHSSTYLYDGLERIKGVRTWGNGKKTYLKYFYK